MFGLGLPELIVILFILVPPIVLVMLSNSNRKKAIKIILEKNKEKAMSYCSKCGKEVLEESSFCQYCGWNLSDSQTGVQTSTTPSGLTKDDFAAFVGKNSEKYLVKFDKFNVGGIDNFKATWNWPAFFVPFWWLLYRKIYGWAILAFFLAIIPYVGLITGFGWAIAANYLYYSHAKKKLIEINQMHTSQETRKAVIMVTGGVGNATLVIGLILGGIAIIGILAAIAIPNFLKFQEKSRKASIIKAMTSAEPELRAWIDSSMKSKSGKSTGLRERDTDGNGVVNDKDLTNAELLEKGVCNQYVAMKFAVGKEKSPWLVNTDLWSLTSGNGQIQCMQNTENTITLTATDNKGNIIETKTVQN